MKVIVKLMISTMIAAVLGLVYRILFTYTEEIREVLMDISRNNLSFFAIWCIVILLLTLIMGYIVQNFHTASGSGLEHITTILSLDSIRRERFLIPLKFLAGLVSVFGNLAFGSVGAVTYVAALASKLFLGATKVKKEFELIFVYSAAAAALAAFSGAHFASGTFIIERYKLTYKHSHWIMIASVITSVLVHLVVPIGGAFASQPISVTVGFCLSLPFFVVLVFVLEILFKKLTVFLLVFYQRHHITAYAKIGMAFLLTSIFALSHPQVVQDIFMEMKMFIDLDIDLPNALLFFLCLFVLTAINFSSTAVTGIFFTSLFLGGFLGAIFGTVCIQYLGIDSANYMMYIFCGMAMFFALANGTPITAAIFISELSQQIYWPVILAVVLVKSLSPLTNFMFQFVNRHNQEKAQNA